MQAKHIQDSCDVRTSGGLNREGQKNDTHVVVRDDAITEDLLKIQAF